MRPLGDRRAHLRLEVVGALWGTLELVETATVLNISTSGALIGSPIPAAPDSRQPVVLAVDGEEITVETQVRHVRRVESESEPPLYLIGVAFVSPPPRLVESIADLAAQPHDTV
jgi:PilZ domain